MDEGGGLQSVVGALTSHIDRSETVQLPIHERRQAVQRLLLTRTPGEQQSRDRASVCAAYIRHCILRIASILSPAGAPTMVRPPLRHSPLQRVAPRRSSRGSAAIPASCSIPESRLPSAIVTGRTSKTSSLNP